MSPRAKDFLQSPQATSARSVIPSDVATFDVAPVIPVLLGDLLVHVNVSSQSNERDVHGIEVNLMQ